MSSDKHNVRAILNGGADGLKALLGKDMRDMDYKQLPAPNLLMSALERFAQKIGRAPDLKVDIFNDKDSERATKRAEKLDKKKNELKKELIQFDIDQKLTAKQQCNL